MIKKIQAQQRKPHSRGGFKIQILFLGDMLDNHNDSGIGTIGRIDHANLDAKTLVPMHPHIDDQIITYMRSGKMKHTDSEGNTMIISNEKLMLMNAGEIFQHEELALENLEALQIFLRPAHKGEKSEVKFSNLPDIYSINEWRLIASTPTLGSLHFNAETMIYDTRIESQKESILPKLEENYTTQLLYVFDGEILVNDTMTLSKGDSLVIKNEKIKLKSISTSDLVLFATNENSSCYKGGMYSGNMHS